MYQSMIHYLQLTHLTYDISQGNSLKREREKKTMYGTVLTNCKIFMNPRGSFNTLVLRFANIP